MSLQPLRISPGRKFAGGLAGILTTTSMAAGWAITAFSSLLLDREETSDPLLDKILFLALALSSAAALVTVSHLLMRIALGRFRTGGSLTRFFRYQLGALGVGGGLGFCFAPAMLEADPAWSVASITAGVCLIAASLLAFRKARFPILDRPPYPSIGLAEGSVIEYWSGSRARAPSLAVVHFSDAQGRQRWARHLVQQGPSMQGTVGQVVYDRNRPERVRRFAVTHQLFDLRPPREILQNPASRSHHLTPMPPNPRPSRRR